MVKKAFLLAALYFGATHAFAQKSEDRSVQLTATVQNSPAKVTLSWTLHPNATGYTIFKKAKNGIAWSSIGNVGSSINQYVDNNVTVDSAYEYRVLKTANSPSPNGEGYIYVGINAKPIHNRGTILLLVDNNFSTTCQTELTTLMEDISSDGWAVLRKDYDRTATDVTIKNYIKTTYQSNSSLSAVYIIGHLKVPYSGNLVPDGHDPDHRGAWPADIYYADMDGNWTDNSINNTSANRAANKNIPGDGKWDQSGLPSNTELQISRIDFYDMPLFGKTETELMKSYLNRAHQYKQGNITVTKRALIDDNFASYDEAFAANGWRNFFPLVGSTNVKKVDFVGTLKSSFYQWAYGCGAGSYKKASGIGWTDSFANNNTNAIFTMMFGSYFGDWDNQNNFLRAPLCSSTPALTSCWAGRPNWFFHHMALGEHIGYSSFISQNNGGIYSPTGFFNTGVHVALLGDLTLRTDYMKPASNLQVNNVAGKGAVLSWTATTEPNTIGYYVYSSTSKYGTYNLESPLVTGTSFTDSVGINGPNWYMVKAVKVEQTPSGSYNNLSLGIKDSNSIIYPNLNINSLSITNNLTLYPNPAKNELNISFASNQTEKANLTILNIIGHKMAKFEQVTIDKNTPYRIDISQYPRGIYLLQLETPNESLTRKWIKAN
ncbi:MAG: T9SS type A sorting domain-containing protein [Flavipsychrobacter sp.]